VNSRVRPLQVVIAVAAFTMTLLLAHAEPKDAKSKDARPKQEQSSKNMGATRPCYDCHKDAKKEFASRKYVHAPVAKADCESCHLRHGFSQKLVLAKPVPELCYTCHDAVKTADAFEFHANSPRPRLQRSARSANTASALARVRRGKPPDSSARQGTPIWCAAATS